MRNVLMMSVAVLAIGFAACQKNSPKQNPEVSGNNLNFAYKINIDSAGSFSTRGTCGSCTVPQFSSNDKNVFCQRLSDHVRNNYCGESERQALFNGYQCEGTFVPDASQSCNLGTTGKFVHVNLPHEVGLTTINMAQYQTLSAQVLPYRTQNGFLGLGCYSGGSGNFWRYNNLADFCTKLQDDQLNNGCAHGVRKSLHDIYCPIAGTGPYTQSNEQYALNITESTNYEVKSNIFDLEKLAQFDIFDLEDVSCENINISTSSAAEYCAVLNDPTYDTGCFAGSLNRHLRDQASRAVGCDRL